MEGKQGHILSATSMVPAITCNGQYLAIFLTHKSAQFKVMHLVHIKTKACFLFKMKEKLY